ncbi:MAG: hypothetical protein Q4E75_00695 [bacterium]|nr:hypothetical protein [bacterium]
MIYFLLGLSLSFNLILILFLIFYYKIKFSNQKKLNDMVDKTFFSDKNQEFDNFLFRK